MGDGKKSAAQHYIEGAASLSANKAFLRDQIRAMSPAELESERVFRLSEPDFDITRIIRHVENCRDYYVTADDARLAPPVPPSLAQTQAYAPPLEITFPRVRYYFLDRNGVLRQIDCEVRQEQRPHGVFKQNTKLGKGGTETDPTLDRMEMPARLISFGFNAYAISDDRLRRQIIEEVEGPCKPVLRLVSQRQRISYHPDGERNVVIELAAEPVHFGETFTGFAWSSPKLDIEIKEGPKNPILRRQILEREEEFLMRLFPLCRELRSSAAPGMDQIATDLQSAHGLQIFDRILPERQPWAQASDLYPVMRCDSALRVA